MMTDKDFWIMTNQAFITAGLMGQGRLYFPLPGVIPVDEFIAEMQRRGYTVWKNKSETTLMVDMNLPKRAEDVFCECLPAFTGDEDDE